MEVGPLPKQEEDTALLEKKTFTGCTFYQDLHTLYIFMAGVSFCTWIKVL